MTQHTSNTDTAMSRIDARVPVRVRETIDRAAALQGRTRTDFLIAAAMEKAERVIEEHSIIRLTLRDQEMLARALIAETVAEPSPRLAEALEEYASRVVSK
ncbi:conserved hypothetical protein [uncultured delta proteobacterium]|uniref:DUF1778 domain-containing protein n=1 Tax=uncultured delta proteobacterium TaxID=34034 RepID=A0A212KH09_9DELT|nr:conserved hypothetical protein [uncultured delta proteobacterium]